jgi:hypothetical protein
MHTTNKFRLGYGILAVCAAFAIALGISAAPRLQGQDRDREADGQIPRQGGIPRRALDADRDRNEEGTEEGVPDAGAQARIKELAPRIAPPRGEWKLGVWVYNSDSGVVISRVQPGSAAERQGLERGDRIVSVGGYQVGYVGDHLYPLGYELQRQAGRHGNVLLLVQNVRNSELASFDVRLDGGGRIRPLPAEDRRLEPATPPRP